MQLNKHVPIIICLASLLSVLSLETAQACKDRYYPQSFPLDELKEYNHVYVVRARKLGSGLTFDIDNAVRRIIVGWIRR